VFRTYFINNRGDEAMGSVWSYLDMTALGRQENWRTAPGYPKPNRTSGGLARRIASSASPDPDGSNGRQRKGDVEL